MNAQQPNRPADGWEEGRAPARLPDSQRNDAVKEPPNEPVPAEGDYGSLDETASADDPVQPFEPVVQR